MIQSAKLIAAGLATISLAGSGVGIGVVFASLIGSIARNPALLKQLFARKKGAFVMALIPDASFSEEQIGPSLPLARLVFEFFDIDSIYVYFLVFVTFFTLAFASSFFLTQKLLPVKDADSRFGASIFIGILSGAEIVHLFTTTLSRDYFFGFTSGFLGLVLLLLIGTFLISKRVRAIVNKVFFDLSNLFVPVIEKIVANKLGINADAITADFAFLLYNGLLTIGFTVFLTVCYKNPYLFQVALLFFFFSEITYIYYHKKWTQTYDGLQHATRIADNLIIYGLFLSIGLGPIFAVAGSFFLMSLLCYLMGSSRYAASLESFKTAYRKAEPTINELDPIRRVKIKYLSLGILLFPAVKTSYAFLLTQCFYFACVGKILVFVTGETTGRLGENFSANATVYIGLYLIAASLFLRLRKEVEISKDSSREEESALMFLIHRLGKNVLFPIIGNPGTDVVETVDSHKSKGRYALLYGLGVYFGVKVIDALDFENRSMAADRSTNRQVATHIKATGQSTVPSETVENYQREAYRAAMNHQSGYSRRIGVQDLSGFDREIQSQIDSSQADFDNSPPKNPPTNPTKTPPTPPTDYPKPATGTDIINWITGGKSGKGK